MEPIHDEFEVFSKGLESFGVTKDITTESIIKKIDSVISSILNTKFTHPSKLQLQYIKNRVNFACPYCGDSNTDPDAKRGNIYTTNLFYVCYNCGEKKGFTSFLKDFNQEDIFTYEEKEYIKTYISENNGKGFSSKSIAEIYNQIITLQEYGIQRSTVMSIFELEEISTSKFVVDYLKSRNQQHVDSRKFAFDKRGNAIVMFNTSPDNNLVYGFQKRLFKVYKKMRFLTTNYSEICLKLGITINDEDLRIRLDKISLFYNIFHVKFSDNIFLFEGTMDANHLNNSMATWSASNKIMLPHGHYLYDNTTIDKAGLDASLEMLHAGLKVFMWSMFLKDFPQFKYCKDLDDIYKTTKIPARDLLPYFSNHPLDIIYL